MITQYLINAFWEFINTLEMIAPALTAAVVAGALIRTLVPAESLRSIFSKGYKSVLLATFIGAPLPICSCSVLPLVASLRRAGVPTYSILPFLLAAPAVSLPSIIIALSMLGPKFTATYVVTVISIALILGALSRWLPSGGSGISSHLMGGMHEHHHGMHECDSCVTSRVSRSSLFIKNLAGLAREVGVRVVIGVLIASLIALLPIERFTGVLSFPAGVFTAAAIAVPMYVCSVGSIPVVSALMVKGLCVGGALVILILGPATNAASIMVLSKIFSKRFTAYYVGLLSALTLLIAVAVNAFELTA